MTKLPPVQYLDEAARGFAYRNWADASRNPVFDIPTQGRIIAHARTLHENAQLRAEIAALRPRATLKKVARREVKASGYEPGYLGGQAFERGFLRAAEMAKAGELPDE